MVMIYLLINFDKRNVQKKTESSCQTGCLFFVLVFVIVETLIKICFKNKNVSHSA